MYLYLLIFILVLIIHIFLCDCKLLAVIIGYLKFISLIALCIVLVGRALWLHHYHSLLCLIYDIEMLYNAQFFLFAVNSSIVPYIVKFVGVILNFINGLPQHTTTFGPVSI